MSEKTLAKIYKDTIHDIEKTNMVRFSEMQEKGEITPDLKNDYREFCNTLREVFEESPGSFKLDKVYVKIPRNSWIPICHNCLLTSIN